MSYLTVEFVKRTCVLIMRIELPLGTMEKLMDLFVIRKIYVESLQMQMMEGGVANLLVNCLIEKDRIQHTRHLIEKMSGVLDLQILESKDTNTVKNDR
jgi:hypothetical protein